MVTEACGPAIAAAFGLGGEAVLTGPVARGEQGQVWRLRTDRGLFAVKDPFFAMDAGDAEADAVFQDAARSAGVALPGVLRSTAGRVLAEVGGEPVRVYTWVDVLPRLRRLDPEQVGELLARIHRAVLPVDAPLPAWYVDPVGAPRWHDLVGRLRTAGAPFADELEALLPQVLAAEAILEPGRATQVCHLDLWADNVLRTPAGGLVVLDWENCGPGDASRELALALVEFGVGEPDRIRALHAAYVGSGGRGRVSRPADLTMVVAQLGHIAEVGCERWLASTTDAERGHNESWVREYLDDPVTPAKIELVLDAVSSPRRT